jgi:hypothetical protein
MDLTADKFGKLSVGDIAKYERWTKEQKKKELIGTMKELYGDNLPDDAFTQIENQLNAMTSLMDDGDVDLEGIQYLLWLSMLKKDKDATFEQVGEWFNIDKAEEYMAFMLPPSIEQKKRPRSPVAGKKAKKKKKKKSQ